MDFEDMSEIRQLIENCQKPLSALYHYLDDLFEENPQSITDEITEFQDRLNEIPSIIDNS